MMSDAEAELMDGPRTGRSSSSSRVRSSLAESDISECRGFRSVRIRNIPLRQRSAILFHVSYVVFQFKIRGVFFFGGGEGVGLRLCHPPFGDERSFCTSFNVKKYAKI